MVENLLEEDRVFRRQLRVFLEEICAELCRFQHILEDDAVPECIKIRREVAVAPGAFLDVLVELPDQGSYALEVKFGYPVSTLLEQLGKKYGSEVAVTERLQRLVLLVRDFDGQQKPDLEAKVLRVIRPDLRLEIWNEHDLLQRIESCFGVQLSTILCQELLDVRRAIDKKKWQIAFGDSSSDRLADTLLWHFGFWNLRRLNREQNLQPENVLAPGLFRDVAIVMADLSSFSSYVRDTRDMELVRHSLTTFYSRARHAIHSAGGMLYQFVGDEVVGLFGIPDRFSGYADQALDCASQLIDIGQSVSNTWQKRLDREQEKSGVHVGVSVGDLNLLPLLPFSESHFGFAGDALNMSARLMAAASPNGVCVSNGLYRLSSREHGQFEAMPNLEAKNVGRVKCWGFRPAYAGSSPI
ncbi:MAG: adenylate/guanylate cyclase domain-containing protein [Pirellulales bacterium]